MKIAVVGSSDFQPWISCLSIENNLACSYQQLSDQHQISFFKLSFEPSLSNFGFLNQELKRLVDFQPEHICLISNKAHPYLCLNFLSKSPELSKAAFHVHCYGDFPVQFAYQKLAEQNWRGLRIRFLTASRAAFHLLQSLVKNPNGLALCPFPVNNEIFQFEPQERASQSFDLLYAGRLSLQKNIAETVRAVSQWAAQRQILTKLTLAGDFDLNGATFFNHDIPHCSYPQSVLTKDLISEQSSRYFSLNWTPTLDGVSLSKLYQQQDAFISLSMHHDEDFGMAPAEALCCGTPCILSAWGGYHDFFQRGQTEGCEDVLQWPLKTNVAGPYFELNKGFSLLDKMHSMTPETAVNRQQRAQRFQEMFSISAIAAEINKLLMVPQQPFDGFDLIKCQQMHEFHQNPLNEVRSFLDPGYKRFYEGYYEWK